MKWYEKTLEEYEKSVKNFREHYTKEELEKYKKLFEEMIQASKICKSKNLEYWEYELKFVNDCLKGE